MLRTNGGMKRERTGGKSVEATSRYQTLRRFDPDVTYDNVFIFLSTE